MKFLYKTKFLSYTISVENIMKKKELKKSMRFMPSNAEIVIKHEGIYYKLQGFEYEVQNDGKVFIVLKTK